MSNEKTTDADAGRLENEVRPVAWTLQSELDARETTCKAHLWFVDPVNSSWAPLYDQAALDAAQAEIGRLRAMLEVSQAATAEAVSKAQWQARTNAELNALHAEVRRLKADACRRLNDEFGA